MSADKRKKRKQQPQPTPVMERLSDQLHSDNQALKRCKQEFIEEDHAAFSAGDIGSGGSSTVQHLL